MPPRKLKIGILGCGAIGSRIAKSLAKDFYHSCELTGLFDIDSKKTSRLSRELNNPELFKSSRNELFRDSQLIVEALNAKETAHIIREALEAGCHVLVMSVGKLLGQTDLFTLAGSRGKKILVPSGAVTGIDTIKAASLDQITSLSLTTRKPLAGFKGNSYIKEKGILLENIKKETVLFEGSIGDALKYFPQNINVAATLALACGDSKKVKIKILTSPQYEKNSHEIKAEGRFGEMMSLTTNTVCDDNPKTSFLAVLSALQVIKQFSGHMHIGT